MCSRFENDLKVYTLDVYYFGYLWENRSEFNNFYASISIDSSYFSQRPMAIKTFGDGNNLPKYDALYARFIVTNNFQGSEDFPHGKDFRSYFQAEEVNPKHSPPFSYDDLYKNYYRGKIKRAIF